MDEVRHLVAQIETLRPFPEVPEALARLKARFRIVVLSNGDPDMLEAAKRHHGIPFDAVISVAVANAFKPHVATYTRAAEIVGVPMHDVLFVANHAFDCIGAKSAGMHTAFVDRRRAAVRRDAAPARPRRRQHDGARGRPLRARPRDGMLERRPRHLERIPPMHMPHRLAPVRVCRTGCRPALPPWPSFC